MFFPFQQGMNIAVILLCACVLAWAVLVGNRRLSTFIASQRHFKGHDRRIQTMSRIFLTSGISLIILIALGMILREVHIDPSPLLASAGIVGLAVSFGAQALIKDVFAGLCILIENQYCEGDRVQIIEISGTVIELTLRKTVIRDEHGALHHIPNGSIPVVTVFPSEK